MTMSTAKNRRWIRSQPDKQLLWLSVFLCFVFVLGGSSRIEMLSLILIIPAAVFFLLYSLFDLKPEVRASNRFVLVCVGLIFLLPALQLIPLPPSLWHGFAGRDLVAEIDKAMGLDDIWRPLTLDPQATWNALLALTVPLAGLVAGLSLTEEGRRKLLPVLLGLILASAVLGVLQILGPNGGPLYFFSNTHADSPVGFLANRNHQAVLLACAIPIIAILATDPNFADRFYGKPLFVIGLLTFILPLIMITGSRTGLAVACVSVGCSLILFWQGGGGKGIRFANRRNLMLVGLGAVAIAAIISVTLLSGRDVAVGRIIAWESESDFRLRAWREIAAFSKDFWPWGTGLGSFVDIYKIYEPHDILEPRYMNQAHNDWLDIVLTGGLPGVLLLALVVGAWGLRAWQMRSPAAQPLHLCQLHRVGLVIIMLLALGSVTDYPLRAPTMAVIFSIAVLWTLPVQRSAKA